MTEPQEGTLHCHLKACFYKFKAREMLAAYSIERNMEDRNLCEIATPGLSYRTLIRLQTDQEEFRQNVKSAYFWMVGLCTYHPADQKMNNNSSLSSRSRESTANKTDKDDIRPKTKTLLPARLDS